MTELVDYRFVPLFGGTFRLNAVNTYKGISQIDGGTNIVLGVDNALPPSGTAMLFSSSLNLNGHDQTLGYFISAGSPTVDLTDATLTIKNDIDPAFGGAWSGTISGSGNLVKTGGGLQQFSLPVGLANTYTGGTTVEQGTLQIIGNINGLPAGAPVVIGKDGCLQLTPTAVDSGLAANTPVTFSGDISGAGELQVTTLETLVLSGNNTYTGGTRISNGRLLVSADNNMGAPSGKITFFSNGSNPGPILTYGAAFNSTRDVTVDTANAFVDTREHNVALGNVQANPLLPQGSFYKLAGTGTLTVNHVRGVNTLGVWEGTLRIAPSGGSAAGVSTAGTLSILPAGRLDLSDNKLITAMAPGTWNGTNYTDVAGLVDAGRGPAGNALWDGTTGIITSDTRAINNGDLVSIGVAKVGDVRTVADTETTTFAGQTVLGSDTLVMATWGGESVDRLFVKIRDTMPPNFGTILDDEEKLAVVAYILQTGGYPSGTRELAVGRELAAIQILRKGEQAAVQNFSLVETVGCLARGADEAWVLISTSEPTVTQDDAPAPGALAAAAVRPLGTGTFRLHSVAPFKPVETGCREHEGALVAEDAEKLRHATGTAAPVDAVCPIRLRDPLAPMVAAERESVTIDVEALAARYRDVR